MILSRSAEASEDLSCEGNLWARAYAESEWRLLYYFWLFIAQCTDYIWKIGHALGSKKGQASPQR